MMRVVQHELLDQLQTVDMYNKQEFVLSAITREVATLNSKLISILTKACIATNDTDNKQIRKY